MSDNVQKEQNTDDSVEERVVQKLKKVITIKKNLTEKQQNHINSLAAKKKGTKYIKQVPETEVELPTEIVPKKPRRVKPVPEPSEEPSEPEVVVIKKKPKKRVEVIEESNSESEEEIKPKKKTKPKVGGSTPLRRKNKVLEEVPAVVVKKAPVKKAPVKKAPVKKAPEPIEEQNQFKSLFNKRLF